MTRPAAFTVRLVGMALIGAKLAATAHAAESTRDVQREIAELKGRVNKLEKQNADLERAREREQIDESDPPLAERLKAIEPRVDDMQRQARTLKGLQGIEVGASVTSVAQRANHVATVDGTGESQLNYRADVGVSLPAGAIGNAEAELFAQARLGQGVGLSSLRPSYGSVNTTALPPAGVSQTDDSAALLAQAWFQVTVPFAGSAKGADRQLQMNFGKLDPFVFFDQNAAAGDETRQFLNNTFVHNPLLDAGGDTGADTYGFQPGLRVAYTSTVGKPLRYALSLGVFGAGPGAHFENTFHSPFAIAQAETHRMFFGDLEGNYRLYAWRNGQATPFNNPAASDTEKHAGWGVSIDQRVHEDVTLFIRYGRETSGRVQFDRAATAGIEVGGGGWQRAADAIGLAAGTLHTSAEFRSAAPVIDADGNAVADFGYTPDASENVYELYYRYRINKLFEVTPDCQVIRQPAGNGAVPDFKVIGLRAQVTF